MTSRTRPPSDNGPAPSSYRRCSPRYRRMEWNGMDSPDRMDEGGNGMEWNGMDGMDNRHRRRCAFICKTCLTFLNRTSIFPQQTAAPFPKDRERAFTFCRRIPEQRALYHPATCLSNPLVLAKSSPWWEKICHKTNLVKLLARL